MSEQEQHARELLVKELGFELFDDPNYPSGPMRMIGVRLLRNRLASKDEAVMWKLLLKRESELSSLRAEVERLRTTVEEREKLLDRFTANNIKLNQELERLKQERISLEVFQQDWMPGFSAFYDDGQIREEAKAHISLNLGSLLAAVDSDNLPAKDLPYMIAESLMHEIIHALEAWAAVDFSEERVERLLEEYRAKYRQSGETHWQYDPSIPDPRAELSSEVNRMEEFLGFEGKQYYKMWAKERTRAEKAEKLVGVLGLKLDTCQAALSEARKEG